MKPTALPTIHVTRKADYADEVSQKKIVKQKVHCVHTNAVGLG